MMPHDLVNAISKMKEQDALDLAERMLNSGEDPLKVLELCRKAVEMVGSEFEAGKYFLPELVLAGEILKQISKMAEPFLKQGSELAVKRLGKVIVGTVKGDIHDIGKDIVVFLLDANGFEVHDLGVDVPAEEFIKAIKDLKPQVVAMSALLTLAFESLKSTIKAIDEAGLRDQVKIMIGGGAVSEEVREYARADAYGADAVAAVTLARQWTESTL
jgi:5-methyltetrahydrofolate--homocysteine methyltransferase